MNDKKQQEPRAPIPLQPPRVPQGLPAGTMPQGPQLGRISQNSLQSLVSIQFKDGTTKTVQGRLAVQFIAMSSSHTVLMIEEIEGDRGKDSHVYNFDEIRSYKCEPSQVVA